MGIDEILKDLYRAGHIEGQKLDKPIDYEESMKAKQAIYDLVVEGLPEEKHTKHCSNCDGCQDCYGYQEYNKAIKQVKQNLKRDILGEK